MLDTGNKHSIGSDQGSTKDPWFTMDFSLGMDSLSLQEMLDVDIKCEIEGVIGGNPELGFNFTDMSPLELDDDPVGCQTDVNWFGSSSLLNGNSNSSHSNFNLDLSGEDAAATIMVNPNSVMPDVTGRSPSPEYEKIFAAAIKSSTASPALPVSTAAAPTRRHFSFPSGQQIKEEQVDIEEDAESENETETEMYENDLTETEDEESEEEEEPDTYPTNIKQKQQITMTNGTSIKTISPQTTGGKSQLQTAQRVNPVQHVKVKNVKVVQNQTTNAAQTQHVRKQTYNNNVHINSGTTTVPVSMKRKIDLTDFDENPYPKPGYSYSCLISMALKNSHTGMLPVSEIYNFMCEHFPYFKTAPSGWKNSVRHNLSLNKCFEKIEKPQGNGNQRKGCLWGINPAKIAKMDDEVSKWSRKDPIAVRNAMICPENLKMLERGEMKRPRSCGEISEETESSGDEEMAHGHVGGNNSMTDSYDESSQDDCDVEMTGHTYKEIDIEDDHVYQPPPTSRRKTTLVVRSGKNNGTFYKIE